MPDRNKSQDDISTEIRKRLRKRLRNADADPPVQDSAPDKAAPEAIVFHRDLPQSSPPSRVAEPVIGPPVDLAEAVGGRQVDAPIDDPLAVQGSSIGAPHGGRAFLVEQRIRDAPGGWDRLCVAFKSALADGQWPARAHVDGLDGVRPEDVAFLDLETTGLTGTPVFLVGLMVWEDDSLVVRQYFARDYAEERAILSLFLREMARRRLLVSFNGKSFDVPYLRTRAAANGLAWNLDVPHCDLLHVARRIWKDTLPNCRLQTLETYICRRGVRDDDIDGSRIPEAYHAFVRTGNAAEMVLCLKHNRLDLITLADLLTRLPAP